LLVGLLDAACGGKAVLDGTASGGSGGGGASGTTTTTTTTFTTTTSITTTDVCEVLGADLAAKLELAMACNPQISVEQCTGEIVIWDQCGCSVAPNVLTPELAQAALDAYNVWVAAGCGPFDCAWCPPGPETAPWYCGPGEGLDEGLCQVAVWD
jgi:hypothetical protein